MLSVAGFAETAALVGDPARASMMTALMDGRALTASELARIAGVLPQTASGHLARLTEAGLLAMERQGRHRYHRLASPAVAHMLESIMSVAAGLRAAPARPAATGPRDAAMREARSCYDHLAGRLAVAMADRMVARGDVELAQDGGVLTVPGEAFMSRIGVDLDAARRRSGRVFCKPCLDWSERRPHIAGALGAAMLAAFFRQNWIIRVDNSRALRLTPPGQRALRQAFALDRLIRSQP